MELIQLDTKDLIGDETVMTVNTIEKIGRKIHSKFTKEKIIDQTQKLEDTKKKNKFPTFKESNTKGQSGKHESKELTLHVRLFS